MSLNNGSRVRIPLCGKLIKLSNTVCYQLSANVILLFSSDY